MTQTHECAQCGKSLVIVHAEGSESWILACGQDKTHQGIRKHESRTALVARGKADQRVGRGAQRDLEQVMTRPDSGYNLTAKKDVGNGDVITVPAMERLVKWSTTIGLNFFLGHVCLYYGEPYVTIDGYYYLLNARSPAVKIGTRPLSPDDLKLYDIPDGAFAWIAEAWLLTTKMPTTGLGIVTRDELDAQARNKPGEFRAPIARAHPQRMAEKRAEWQLLRKIVPIAMVEETERGVENG